jgi:molecular chaperone DnaK (HSP70)
MSQGQSSSSFPTSVQRRPARPGVDSTVQTPATSAVISVNTLISTDVVPTIKDIKAYITPVFPHLFVDNREKRPVHYLGVTEKPTLDGYNTRIERKESKVSDRNKNVNRALKYLLKAQKKTEELEEENYELTRYLSKLRRSLKDNTEKIKEQTEMKKKNRKRKTEAFYNDEDYQEHIAASQAVRSGRMTD